MGKYYVSGRKDEAGHTVNCDDSEATFWTLYERDDQGLSQSIIDLKFRKDAVAAMAIYVERNARVKQLQEMAADNAQMLQLLTDISNNHVEYFSEGEDGMFAGVPLDYVSKINMYVDRDVNAENPFEATDAVIGKIEHAARAEGIIFAANRIIASWESGFIDATAREVADVSGAVLSAIEFLPDASPNELERDYADSVRNSIEAQLYEKQQDENMHKPPYDKTKPSCEGPGLFSSGKKRARDKHE